MKRITNEIIGRRKDREAAVTARAIAAAHRAYPPAKRKPRRK